MESLRKLNAIFFRLPWVILAQLDLAETRWLLFPGKEVGGPLHQMVTGCIYWAFLVPLTTQELYIMSDPPTHPSHPPHPSAISNHVQSSILNTATGLFWGSRPCSRTHQNYSGFQDWTSDLLPLEWPDYSSSSWLEDQVRRSGRRQFDRLLEV